MMIFGLLSAGDFSSPLIQTAGPLEAVICRVNKAVVSMAVVTCRG